MNRNEFFQALPITRLSIRLTSAALEICTDDIDDVHVMISGSQHDVDVLRVSAAADTLVIEQPVAAMAKSAVSSSWMQLTLRVPTNWKGAIEARTVTGWMNLRRLSGTDLSLDTVSGMVMASGMDFITISARSVVSDVKLTDISCDSCSMVSTSGSVSALAAQLRKGSMTTVTGLITLALLAPFEELTCSTVTGEIAIDAPIDACDATLRSVSGRLRTGSIILEEGAPRLRATTVSSDVDLCSTLEENNPSTI